MISHCKWLKSSTLAKNQASEFKNSGTRVFYHLAKQVVERGTETLLPKVNQKEWENILTGPVSQAILQPSTPCPVPPNPHRPVGQPRPTHPPPSCTEGRTPSGPQNPHMTVCPRPPPSGDPPSSVANRLLTASTIHCQVCTPLGVGRKMYEKR